MRMLLIAGVGVLVAGLLAIGFGIPVKEFSFGNTLILAGAIAACTGAILFGLSVVVRELQNIAQRLDPGGPALSRIKNEPQPPAMADAMSSDQPSGNDEFPFSRDRPASENPLSAEPSPSATSVPSWLNDIPPREPALDRTDTSSEPAPPEPAPPTKPKRNLLFSSSSRKERERAAARNADPSVVDPPATPAGPPPAPDPTADAPPIRFDEAWPQSERPRSDSALRRGGRTPSTFTEANGTDRLPPAMPSADVPPVTVLKSGVVDGMAYSLYSDGSIEAQMPEGMMRFASIDELRSHLDHRP